MSTPKANPMQNLVRLTGIAWVLLQEYRILRRFEHGAANDKAPFNFAARLVALGPVFVKLGQILSTRPELLPQAYVEALSTLQEKGPELSIEQVRRSIERELGKPLEALFAAFVQAPVAAASLAQVHQARLPDGTAVAVKVQRPDLERLMGSVIERVGNLRIEPRFHDQHPNHRTAPGMTGLVSTMFSP